MTIMPVSGTLWEGEEIRMYYSNLHPISSFQTGEKGLSDIDKLAR
jgi:hypothetical protein